jgi:hypothetical protein
VKVVAVLLVALAITALPATSVNAEVGEPFRIGVYLYENHFEAAAREHGQKYADFLDEHLRILRDHGVNAIYLGATTRERFDDHLRLAGKHGMKLIPQLDFAYFQPDWSADQMDVSARAAGEFIHRYRDEARVLAWSVREEVPHAAVGALARYYATILKHAPGARFNLVHNQIEAARDQPAPHPSIIGTDRYAFWFEVSGGGYLASPAFALDWTRQEAARYFDEAERRGADFMLVVTQGGLLMPQWANQIITDPEAAGVPGDDEEREQVRRRVLRFAEDCRMGWRKVDLGGGDVRYNFWKYYRLPHNCMRALAWTSVLEGAKLFFVWSYAPPLPSELALGAASAATQPSPRHEFNWITLAGRPGLPNPQLEELAEASREIRAYERVIVAMRKVGESPIACEQSGIHHRAFRLPETPGYIVVLHNANVGRWRHDSRRMFNEDDDVRIDDAGNLVGYVAFTEPAKVRFTLGLAARQAGFGVFDVRNGQPLAPDANGVFSTPANPGSGTLVYVGSAEGSRRVKAGVH